MVKKEQKNSPEKYLNLLKQNKILLFLALTFCASVFLRFYNLSRSLFFGPEQGVDFFRIKKLAVEHGLLLVGAKTDIAGVFHGPIYYYLSTVPFILSRGSPVFIAFFLIVLNSLTVFPLYQLCREMFSKRVGTLAVIFFAVSFTAISYTHWLSSHPLVIPLSTLFLLGFYKFIKGNNRFLLLVSLCYALLGQAEFLNYLFFGGILFGLIIINFKTFKKQTFLFLLLNIFIFFLFGVLHYIIFELRNQFIMTHSLLGLAHGKGYYVSLGSVLQQTYSTLGETISGTILPFFPAITSLLIITIALFFLLKSSHQIAKRLIPIYVFVPIFLLLVLRHAVLLQFFVYAIIPVIILEAFLLDKIIQKNRFVGFVICAVLVLLQIRIWYLYVPGNHFMFFASSQPDLHLQDEKAVIDEIYNQERGKNFSFQSYTIPYWSQQAWEYLFWQYGKAKYGYEPVTENGKTIFVIVQDDPSAQGFQKEWLKKTVTTWGTEKSSFRKGIFTVHVLDVPWVK